MKKMLEDQIQQQPLAIFQQCLLLHQAGVLVLPTINKERKDRLLSLLYQQMLLERKGIS